VATAEDGKDREFLFSGACSPPPSLPMRTARTFRLTAYYISLVCRPTQSTEIWTRPSSPLEIPDWVIAVHEKEWTGLDFRRPSRPTGRPPRPVRNTAMNLIEMCERQTATAAVTLGVSYVSLLTYLTLDGFFRHRRSGRTCSNGRSKSYAPCTAVSIRDRRLPKASCRNPLQ
jgi:hypothetical protein